VVAQRLDGGGEIRHLKLEPVPASGLGQPAVGHGLATTRAAAGCAEHEPQIAARQHGKGRSGMHLFAEAQLLAVEGDRGIDVVDDVADAHGGHRCPPRILFFGLHQHPR
jgi:hypothetical protein